MLTSLIPTVAALAAAAEAGASLEPAALAAALEPAPLLAVLEDAEEIKDRWNGSVSAGLIWTDGNTDRFSASVTGRAAYRREKDRTTLDFLWNYAEENERLTDRRLFGAAQYDYFLSEKDYLLAQASGEYNSISELDLRATVGAGYGRQIHEDEVWNLSGEIGAAWVKEDYSGAVPQDADFLAARLAYVAGWRANERLQFASNGRLLQSVDDTDDVSSRLDSFAQLSLSERLFTKLQWIWEWDNTPAAGRDKNDHQVLLTLGWTF